MTKHEPPAAPSMHSTGVLDTHILIDRIQGGDRSALEVLFTRYYGAVVSLVRGRMGPSLRRREEVEDVAQLVMLRAFRSIGEFEVREDAHLIDWLARLTHNEIATLAAFHGRDKRDLKAEVPMEALQVNDASESNAWAMAADESSIPNRVARKEMSEKVLECIHGLPDTYREVLLLRNISNASWEYITLQLGLPSKGAAKQLALRAKQQLMAALKNGK
ncbi:MAG: RNA polymerase sigma factor (sigma-70 family) [Planctomycetota bacterium]|jgi:RNA polymerase sigma factor (sigma-70 family)